MRFNNSERERLQCPHCDFEWRLTHPIERIYCPMCRRKLAKKSAKAIRESVAKQ